MIINKFMYTMPKYRCNHAVMKYLVFKCGLTILDYSKDGNHYYFSKTETLDKHLREMPLRLKLANRLW